MSELLELELSEHQEHTNSNCIDQFKKIIKTKRQQLKQNYVMKETGIKQRGESLKNTRKIYQVASDIP